MISGRKALYFIALSIFVLGVAALLSKAQVTLHECSLLSYTELIHLGRYLFTLITQFTPIRQGQHYILTVVALSALWTYYNLEGFASLASPALRQEN
jgi:hypothetical protein